jgi:tol-pal system protein YbgF
MTRGGDDPPLGFAGSGPIFTTRSAPLPSKMGFGNSFPVAITMTRKRSSVVLLALLTLALAPAFGVSKEIVQLQTQVQQLQEQMTAMQRSFDERMGVMNNLVQQDADAVNKVGAALTALQNTLVKQETDSAAKVDQVSGQIQALNDSIDELKARLTKVGKALEDMQSQQQSIQAAQAADQAKQQAMANAPPPDVLYNNALRDYNGNHNDLATQEFSDYVKFYPNTDLAGNAYFYLGEIQFREGKYDQAAQSYDQVLQNFPTGNKAASAQLKKGFALIELGKQDDGVSELRRLIQRYPKSNEALQARERLHKLGVPSRPGV